MIALESHRLRLSLNNFQKLAKPSKMGICELVFCLVVLKWCTADGIMFHA